jgi:hypothetical protein
MEEWPPAMEGSCEYIDKQQYFENKNLKAPKTYLTVADIQVFCLLVTKYITCTG